MLAHLHRFTASGRIREEEASVVVVSGLPRSGTSLLMQMLTAGGMPILNDGVRKADADNPRGYFELEVAKNLRNDAGFLERAEGRALKIVAPLVLDLPSLPARRYRIIFCERNLDEVMASQSVMLERAEMSGAETDRDDLKLRDIFRRQLAHLRAELEKRSDFETIFVRYPSVIADPDHTSRALAAFLEADLDVRAMAGVVEPSLYRQHSRG